MGRSNSECNKNITRIIKEGRARKREVKEQFLEAVNDVLLTRPEAKEKGKFIVKNLC